MTREKQERRFAPIFILGVCIAMVALALLSGLRGDTKGVGWPGSPKNDAQNASQRVGEVAKSDTRQNGIAARSVSEPQGAGHALFERTTRLADDIQRLIAERDRLQKELDAARNDNVWREKWVKAVDAAAKGLVWDHNKKEWVERG